MGENGLYFEVHIRGERFVNCGRHGGGEGGDGQGETWGSLSRRSDFNTELHYHGTGRRASGSGAVAESFSGDVG